MSTSISDEKWKSGFFGQDPDEKTQPRNGYGILTRKGKLPDAIHALEKQMICEALARTGGNRSLAAELLGITQRMLGYRIKLYELTGF